MDLLLGKRLHPRHPFSRAEIPDFVKLAGLRISPFKGTGKNQTEQTDSLGGFGSLLGGHNTRVRPKGQDRTRGDVPRSVPEATSGKTLSHPGTAMRWTMRFLALGNKRQEALPSGREWRAQRPQ